MSNEKQTVTGKTDLPVQDFAEQFVGNVDSIKDDLITGWVVYKEDTNVTVKLGLWVGNRCIVEQSVDTYRPDLVAIREDGRCSFELALPAMLASIAGKTQQLVRVLVSANNVHSVLVEDVFKEKSEKASDVARDRAREAFWLANVLTSVDNEEADSSLWSKFGSVSAPDKFISRIHDDRPSDSPKKVPTNGDIPELSPFVRYTLNRFKLDKLYNVDNNPWEAAEALMWYIEGYGSTRKPLRIPLSKKEISYCNTMLNFPGCRFQISRAHYFYLLKNRPDFAPASLLNDEPAYVQLVYSWMSEITPDLNMSDVLVPAVYIDRLKQQRAHWKDRRFAINDYYEVHRHKEHSLQDFNAESAIERGLMYLVMWLESGGNACCNQLMPEDVWADLFETVGQEGLTFYEEMAIDLLDGASLEDVRELYQLVQNSQRRLLRRSGFDIDKSVFTTRDKFGNRRHLPFKVSNNAFEGPCDLQVIGPIDCASGLGQATRLSVLALREAGLDPHIVNFDLDNPAPTGFSTPMEGGAPRQSKVNLVHLNAEAAPFAAAYLPDIFSESYNIGYFFWELDSPAKCHSLALEMFDEVWVSSEYGVEQYTSSWDGPVTNVGMTYEELETPSKEECRKRLNEEYGIDDDETVFLTTFDSFSFVQRKNPKAVIESFCNAFPKGDERVRLIIKTQNRNSVLDPVQKKIWKSVDNLIVDDTRIQLVNKTMVYTDLLWFKKAADCYVSLHRSEGWGFGMIESMMLEVPIVATAYSGNLEFCKDDNCWLVETDQVYLDHDDYIFVVPGQKWGEPCVKHAATCLRDAYEDKSTRLNKAKIANEFVRDKFSPSVIGLRYAVRLAQIESIIQTNETIQKAA